MLIGAVLNVGAGFLNGGAGTGMVDFFHGFQLALMMTIMLNLTQFVWWRCKASRKGSTLHVHTPTLIMLLASILVNIQPMGILVIGSWKLCCGHCESFFPGNNACTSTGFTYPPWSDGTARECAAPGGNVFWDVSYCTGQKYAVFPSVASGWAIQVCCTWGGFVFMFIAVMLATQLHVKLKKRWVAIRRGAR